MNTKFIWIIVAIVVLAGVIGLMLHANKVTSTPDMTNSTISSTTDTTATTSTPTASSSMSLKELMAGSGSVKCDFSDSTGGAETSGTTYVASGKVRGDFTSVAGGKTSTGHMVISGNVMNTWIDGMATGFKISIDTSKSAASSQASFDPNKKIDYRCEPWVTDASKFSLPSGITFTDISAYAH